MVHLESDVLKRAPTFVEGARTDGVGENPSDRGTRESGCPATEPRSDVCQHGLGIGRVHVTQGIKQQRDGSGSDQADTGGGPRAGDTRIAVDPGTSEVSTEMSIASGRWTSIGLSDATAGA